MTCGGDVDAYQKIVTKAKERVMQDVVEDQSDGIRSRRRGIVRLQEGK